jgi:hypothetical protein
LLMMILAHTFAKIPTVEIFTLTLIKFLI